MPTFKVETTITVVRCDRDARIVWDGGILRIKAGQYLGRLLYDGMLVVLDESEISEATPAEPNEMDANIEAELIHMIESGRGY